MTRVCAWCNADISEVATAVPIMYARWGGPDDNWQCADEDACERRQDRLDIAVGLPVRPRRKVLALKAAPVRHPAVTP